MSMQSVLESPTSVNQFDPSEIAALQRPKLRLFYHFLSNPMPIMQRMCICPDSQDANHNFEGSVQLYDTGKISEEA